MERVTLTLLGGFGARLGLGNAIVLPRRKAQALLAYLGLHVGLACPRETLAALLWGDVPADQARHSLRQALMDLRRAFPNGKLPTILVEGDSLVLNPRRVEVDVAAFEQLASQHARKALEQAAALYAGDLLAGLTLRESAFEDWLRAERDRLRETALRALRRLLAAAIAAADLESAVQTALRFLAIEPLDEPVHRELMQLYERLGRRAAALRQYQHCANVLHRELGLAPETETRRLYERLTPGATEAGRGEMAHTIPVCGGCGRPTPTSRHSTGALTPAPAPPAHPHASGSIDRRTV